MMTSVRNNGGGTSGIVGAHMAGDMDEEGLIAFNAMAQEAMKIERLVVQQRELSKKLEEMLAKSEKSKEKALDRKKLLHSDIHSYATKNKLLKDNLHGKRSTRNMVEQMTCDLERQLQLECNDINNKKSGFLQVQRKYSEMWEQYEHVYLSSEEAKVMLQVRTARKEAAMLLQKYQQDKENIILCINKTIKTKEADIGKLIIKFASLQNEFKVLQDESNKTNDEMQAVSEEMSQKQQELQKLKDQQTNKIVPVEEIDVEKPTKPETEKATNKDTNIRNRYKSLLAFNHITLPGLELPTIEQEDLPMTLEENDSTEDYDFALRYDFLEEQDFTLQCSVTQVQDNPMATLPPTQESGPVAMVQEQTDMDTETQPSSHDIMQQPPQPAMPLEELNQTEHQEISEEAMLTQNTETPEIAASEQADCSEVLVEQSQNCEQNIEDEPAQLEQADHMQDEEMQPEMESQGWEADSCQGELITANGQMPYFTSAMSQSSEGSNFDLLDDAKRQAYLRKLMASPEFPVESRSLQPPVENEQYANHNLYHSYQQLNPETMSQGGQDNSEQTNGEINQDPNPPNPQAGVPQEQPQAPEQPSTLSSFAPMNSLFGPSFGQEHQQQPQHTAEQSGFSFGSFSFDSAMTQNATPTNFFGGGSPFGDPSPTAKGSEAFNLNFNDKTNSSSIFKLF